ncbi:MAG: ribonuclease III [Clostridiales bacterium]|nr:ribonuclease III [Clostridiales bacterium]
MRALQNRLHYTFRDPELLLTAVTHPSYGADHRVPHNQRLEFLGDAVLQLVISQRLYRMFPGEGEGTLSRARALVVREQSLSDAASALRLGGHLRLSPGEERSGGRDKPSILADALEAVFAAVYLDGGLDAATGVILAAMQGALAGDLIEDSLDYKSLLQMRVQQAGLPFPVYELVCASGQPHLPHFVMRVLVDGRPLGEGEGASKQAAQQQAARVALQSDQIPQ